MASLSVKKKPSVASFTRAADAPAFERYGPEFDARTGATLTLHDVATDAVTDLQPRADGSFAYWRGDWSSPGCGS